MRAILVMALPILFGLALAPSAAADPLDPAAPQNVDIIALAEGFLVTWQPPLEGDVAGYVVERILPADGPGPVQLDPTVTQFLDPLDPATVVAVVYEVTAVQIDGGPHSTQAAEIIPDFTPEGLVCGLVIGTNPYIDGECVVDLVTGPIPDDDTRLTLREVGYGVWWTAWDLLHPNSPSGDDP